MEIQKTHEFLFNADSFMGGYLEKHKNSENKLCQAIKKIARQLQKIFENYHDELDDLQLNNCLVDEKTKAVLKDENGNRLYTVEGTKKLKIDRKTLLQKQVSIHSRIPEGIDDLIKELTDDEKMYFSELVIPKQENLESEN